jgi:hypothetical protein
MPRLPSDLSDEQAVGVRSRAILVHYSRIEHGYAISKMSSENGNPVITKYLGRLAAADVFIADNAYVMFEALRVEYGMLGPFGDHP